MLQETLCGDWLKLKATNFTDASFATLQSTITEPTGDGVIDMANGGPTVQNGLRAKFFGTDANNENFNVRIYGWDRWYNSTLQRFTWENALLCQLAVTLGNLAGVASCMIEAADFEADTIALTYGNDDISVDIVSPANDVRGAHILFDTKGCRKVQFQFDRNSSASSANAAVRSL